MGTGMDSVETTYKEIRELFAKKRKRDASKGDFGRVLVIAGSKGMAGAAILCARGALRAGAGLVSFFVPDELLPIVQTAVPEATCLTEPLSPEALAVYDAIAVGPGLGTSERVREIVSYVLENYGGAIVLDADALNIIAGTNIKLDPDTIITPHPGEASRLLGTPTDVVQARRDAAAAFLAEAYGCVSVLKGAGTLVSTTDPSLKIYLNTTGNPGMATGGSGDVLTGVIASFAAQGMNTLTAAQAGVYVHGLAGDLAAEGLGEAGLIAGDLPDAIAKAIKQLTE
ncbi:MAG: NAD(P)H-hydrate dehydratase [Clostridiales bacterium]|nr:NAD(P)H-hydrate dehydratase [Clostridiales bacterium]